LKANNSIPGVLKNAIEWLKRPLGQKSFTGKVAGIIGATPGMSGTINAQNHLRDILGFLNVLVIPQPMVLVSGVQNKLDKDENLQLDEIGQKSLSDHINALVELAKKNVR
jgi:chromate reductase, NAD(P)H dehydrogenase (quinone)